jgi:hypothetical protein
LKKNQSRISSFVCLLIVLFVAAPLGVFAQKYDFGGGLGVATYSGDITRLVNPEQLGFQGTLFGRRNFDNVWSIRGGISFARLNAADSLKPIDPAAALRNGFFKGSLAEVSVVAEYHFLDFMHPQARYRFSPYGFLGLGYSTFSGSGQTFQGDPDAGTYLVSTPVIPFGIGIKYKLSKQWILATELGFRATFTDNLDKIDSKQASIPRFPDPNNPNAPYGYNYGNYSDKDWYYFLGVTLSYSFYSVKCFSY